MIQLEQDVPFCCRTIMIGGFEPGHVHDGVQVDDVKVQNRIWNDIIGAVNKELENSAPERTYYGSMTEDWRPAVIMATTTNLQTNAEKVLKELGFKPTKPAKVPGDKHKVTVWTISHTAWVRRKNEQKKLDNIKTLW